MHLKQAANVIQKCTPRQTNFSFYQSTVPSQPELVTSQAEKCPKAAGDSHPFKEWAPLPCEAKRAILLSRRASSIEDRFT
jgi:hypothetical protein